MRRILFSLGLGLMAVCYGAGTATASSMLVTESGTVTGFADPGFVSPADFDAEIVLEFDPNLAPVAPGILTLAAFGDFAAGATEFVQVFFDGIDEGILFNNDPTDDLFANAANGVEGLEYGGVRASEPLGQESYAWEIAVATLAPLVLDGEVVVGLNFGAGVDNLVTGSGAVGADYSINEFVNADLTFEAVEVPEPTSCLLALSGAAACGVISRRRRDA